MPCARRSATTSPMSRVAPCGSRKSSCSAVPQRTSGAVQRPLPEHRDQAAHQQRLDQRHLRVRRHLEAAQLEQPEPAARGVGAVQLVDAELGAVGVAGQVGEQVPQRAVDQPRPRLARRRRARSTSRAISANAISISYDRLGPALVEARRLAGRADEATGEEVGQRRVPLPVGDQADQQVGPAQQRRVDRLRCRRG